MLEGHRRGAPAYWIELGLSIAIATLGLVLGSSAVVIGAMLISPLMQPIVSLGMGLAVGSPLLTVRAVVRITGSVIIAIAGASLMTIALPYREMTAEIAARTSPTLLDLLVAVGCALAAAGTTMRQGSSTLGAAAGTAIGIALAPPLCVIGFGIGTGDAQAAAGASLLFIANLAAILVVAVLVFLLFGFDEVTIYEAEAAHFGVRRPAPMIAEFLHRAFRSRWSPVVRVLMPMALLAGIAIPLREALLEVKWKVGARAEVLRILNENPVTRSALRSQLVVDRHAVALSLVLVGTPDEIGGLKDELETRIAASTGAVPTIEILALPDEDDVRRVAQAAALPAPRPAVPVVPAPPRMDDARRRVAEALAASWPGEEAGALLGFRIELPHRGGARLLVVHAGDPLGPAAERLLATAIGARIQEPLTITDVALRAQPLEAEPGQRDAFLRELGVLVAAARDHDLALTATFPAGGEAKATENNAAALTKALEALPAGRVTATQGTSWTARIHAPAEPAPTPAASPAAPASPAPVTPPATTSGN